MFKHGILPEYGLWYNKPDCDCLNSSQKDEIINVSSNTNWPSIFLVIKSQNILPKRSYKWAVPK